MKKYTSIILLLLVQACSVIRPVPVETNTVIERRDSIIYKTDTLRIEVPHEVVKEIVPDVDSLFMETSVAWSRSWLDQQTKTLRGEMRNKKTSLSKEQIVGKEVIHYRDSIVYKELPVEVEKEVRYVPKFYKWLLRWNIIILLAAAAYAFLKLRKVI